ncbi:MAG: YigZ family protein [Clostridiales bacterium]|nr:YigZ family protein [Clostridiales bacterium]
MNDYFTLKNESRDEFTEKRSRFIGYAKPVADAEEAAAFINEIRSKHWDATHNVYAYVLREGQTRRYSDDGEPSGTAGVPVLDVLLKENLTDCAVVATRYFGGVLLGAGGLVRAYSHTSKIAVSAAGIIRMSLCDVLRVVCDYNFYGRLTALIPDCGGVVENADFGESVTVVFYLPCENTPSFISKLTELSLGKISPTNVGKRFEEVK